MMLQHNAGFASDHFSRHGNVSGLITFSIQLTLLAAVDCAGYPYVGVDFARKLCGVSIIRSGECSATTSAVQNHGPHARFLLSSLWI